MRRTKTTTLLALAALMALAAAGTAWALGALLFYEQAETFSESDADIGIVTPSDAEGQKALRWTGPGQAKKAARVFSEPGATAEIRAKATADGGVYPLVQVYVDSVSAATKVGEVRATSTGFATFSFAGSVPSGTHDLIFRPTDSTIDGSAVLVIDYAKVYGADAPPPPLDTDGDGVADASDNCKDTANADQKNLDGDALGDACDGDRDGDGAANAQDNCPDKANPDQRDSDGDGKGDACDAGDEAPPLCAGSLQSKIDATAPGGTVTADACLYREDVSISKPLTLNGKPGSEIRGSDVWKAWTFDGTYYRSAATLPAFPQEDVSCETGTERCRFPEQVFVSNAELNQVAASPGAGQFAVDAERRVVLRDDPRNRLVEVSVRRQWVTGTGAADGVTISGFTMRHAANEWRSGALQSREGTTVDPTTGALLSSRKKADGQDWNVLNNDLYNAHGAVVSVRGPNANVEGNEIAHGGQLGIHNPGYGSAVKNNDIHHNNDQGFCKQLSKCVGYDTDGSGTVDPVLVESGGFKSVGDAITITANHFHDNNGHGVWFDVGSDGGIITDNRIYGNARNGVFFEISTNGTISGNVIYDNGFGTPEAVEGSGIQVGNSDTTEVFGNTLAWNADGLIVRCLNRDTPGQNDNLCIGNYVHDNTVLQANTSFANDGAPGLAQAFTGPNASLYDPANNNRGSGGRYYYPNGENATSRYAWSSQKDLLADFNATPGEEGGRYLTQSEKDGIVSAAGVPASPR